MFSKIKNTLEFETGEDSCICGYEEYCPFLRTTRFGTSFLCDLFGKDITESAYLPRLPECLAKFNKKENSENK